MCLFLRYQLEKQKLVFEKLLSALVRNETRLESSKYVMQMNDFLNISRELQRIGEHAAINRQQI